MTVARVLILLFSLALLPPPADAGDVGLPKGYWDQPLKPQGRAPQAWSDLEASLDPQSCGACHADKLEEWRGSLHAKAFSPGLIGQLLSFSPQETQDCLNCHAPLAEQAAAFEAARRQGKGHLAASQGLAAAGNSCGGCHVRGHKRFGPPQRGTAATGPSLGESPHGGVTRTADFERPEFCGTCHQFSADQAINGKPLENTVEEWRQSPQAKAGQTCQTCHMPDRKHLWRGIHDPATVEAGLEAKVVTDRDRIRVTLTSRAVGHAFPTYVTPKAILHAVLIDGRGQARPETEATVLIQRRVAFDGTDWRELSDTRLLPGQSAGVEIAWGDATQARVWLEVQPDDFYHVETYSQLLRDLPPKSAARRLIAEADARAAASVYSLFAQVVSRPGLKTGR
ncbi:MAG: hypothetical protein HY055_02850 [Magnetospirillum sp.]|nr:hypothetical protein [Magnetospirillum sp.]